MTDMDEATVNALISAELDRRGLTSGLSGRVARFEKTGTGSPENIVTGDYKGQFYYRDDGGAGTCLYVYEGSPGGNSGWAAK
jgi:hypothetical protein